MPHLKLEYSANLASKADITQLCHRLKQTMMSSGLFELGAIRVRAFAANHYAIADELTENAFLDCVLRIGSGRTPAERKALGDKLMATIEAELAPLFTRPHFALSLEIREIDPAFSWKRNAIHPRLRQTEVSA